MSRRKLHVIFAIFTAINTADACLTLFGITKEVFYEAWLSKYIMGLLGDWQGILVMKLLALTLGFVLMQTEKRQPELFAGEGLAVLTGVVGIATIYSAIAIFIAV